MCDRAVLLQDGAVAIDGSPREVIDLYNAQVVAKSSGVGVRVVNLQESTAADAPGNTGKEEVCAENTDQIAAAPTTTGSYSAGAVRLASVAVLQHQKPAAAVMADVPMTVRVSAEFQDDCKTCMWGSRCATPEVKCCIAPIPMAWVWCWVTRARAM